MKNIFLIFIFMVLLSCQAPVEPSDNTTKTVNVSNEEAESEDSTDTTISNPGENVVFTKIPLLDQILFDDYVYAGNNVNSWIDLDLTTTPAGTDAEDCIAVIRVESIEVYEDPAEERVFFRIRKPDPLLFPFEATVLKDVIAYEGMLWADENGHLEIQFQYDFPYEIRQRVRVRLTQYAKTK